MRIFVALLTALSIFYFWDVEYNNGRLSDVCAVWDDLCLTVWCVSRRLLDPDLPICATWAKC